MLSHAKGVWWAASAGGRWDSLLKASWPLGAAAAGAPPGATGVTLNIERLLDCMPAPRTSAVRASQVSAYQQTHGVASC